MPESLLLSPAMTTGLIKGLISPHRPSLSFPTLCHGAVLGELGVPGPSATHPCIPVESGQLCDSCCVPGIHMHQKAARDNTASVSFSSRSLAQANVSCQVHTLSLPKCISYTAHVTLLSRRACLASWCVPVCVFISLLLSVRTE